MPPLLGDSNRHFYLIIRRTAKHKKDLSVLLCIQDQSATTHSTKLNQQNENYCLSREKLLISGDIESNPGPAAHRTSTHTAHTIVRNPSIGLLQARLAKKGLKVLECTSDGSCFFSCLGHQLCNDPSYHMNEISIRNNRQKFIGPITEQLCVCFHSNIHGVMHLLCKQFAMY